MSGNAGPDEGEFRAHLQGLGEPQVRLLLSNGGLPTQRHAAAVRWLSDQGRESDRIREASQAEQLEIARSAKDAAWAAAGAAERAASAAEAANKRATMALIIAAISITVTIIGGFVVHKDTLRESSAKSSVSPQK